MYRKLYFERRGPGDEVGCGADVMQMQRQIVSVSGRFIFSQVSFAPHLIRASETG